jgi:glycosyltransferase involved in cell wall biosynthesis
MILLDAIYINNSGGKVLLDYLVKNFEDKGADIFYLLDDRCSSDYNEVPVNRKIFMKGSLRGRRNFYVRNKNRFSYVLCFGNIPPPIKLNAYVMTYFHQPLYLGAPQETSLSERLQLRLKTFVIRSFDKNTDHWAVQSGNIASLMHSKWSVSQNRIRILPFYPPIALSSEISRSDNDYLFVSNGYPHKNHFRLIEAFGMFSKQFPNAVLHLTIAENYERLLNHISLCQQEGVKIINHGLLPRNQLGVLYRSCGFLIYPSLAESFGLGLMEAIDMGCKVIAADLPYVHAVCRPTLLFDPLNTTDIHKALVESRSGQFKPAELTISNQIDHILSLFNL